MASSFCRVFSTYYTNMKSIEAAPTTSKALRLLMVTARYVPYIGGTEVHTYEVARRMAAAGHDVTVLTTDVNKTLPPVEFSEGVRVERVAAGPAHNDFYFAPGIYKSIMNRKWD